MNENINPQVPNNTPAVTDVDIKTKTNTQSQDRGGDDPVERVFDITPDLNISPVNEVKKNTSVQPKPVSVRENSSPVAKTPTDTEKFSKKALRTYEGDVAEFMSHNRTSATSIAIAENAKKEKALPLLQKTLYP